MTEKIADEFFQHGPSCPVPQMELSDAHRQAWTETRAALLFAQPFYAHIFLSLLTKHGAYGQMAVFTESDSIPMAATDGRSIIINPGPFFDLNINERIFVLCHEIQHCVFQHMPMMLAWTRGGYVAYTDGTKLDYHQMLMNGAADYVINDLLVESKVGAMPQVDGKQCGLWDKSVATWEDQSADVYRKLYNKIKPPPKGGGQGKGNSGQGQPGNDPGKGMEGFDKHLAPGSAQGDDPDSAQGEVSEREWHTEVAQAAQVAKSQGRLPATLERLLGDILEPRVDWTQQIQAFFARAAGGGGYNWRMPDRRLITRRPKAIYAPRRSGNGAGPIAIGVDTSGSIGGPTLDMFMGEVAGILRGVRPTVVYVVWCDAKVHRVDVVKDMTDLEVLRCKGAPGGGGTSFVPVFDWAKDKELDALVYLTDGYGTFPSHEPTDYQLLWGSITPGYKYPFGKVVEIPQQV